MAFKIQRKDEKDAAIYELSGVIDELADFSPLKADRKIVVLDFEAVDRVNSYGVKKWLVAMKALAAGASLRYRRCPVGIVEQVNMVSGLHEVAQIESFYLPYGCQCHEDEVRQLVTTAEAKAPGFIDSLNERFACSRCDRKLEFADDEGIYFEFLGLGA